MQLGIFLERNFPILFLAQLIEACDDPKIDVFCFQSHVSCLNQIHGIQNIVCFETDPNQPGYWRKFEPDSSKYELVFLCGENDLCLLQAYHRSKHSCVVWIPSRPLSAIDEQNSTLAKFFLKMSDTCIGLNAEIAQSLSLKGVISKTKIVPFPTHLLKFDEAKRISFRKRIQIEPHEILIGMESHSDLEKELAELWNSVVFLNPLNFKIIIAGTFSDPNQLKKFAYDTGHGQRFYFLNQNIEQFRSDFESSCDVFFIDGTQHLKSWDNLLQKLSLGLIPLVHGSMTHPGIKPLISTFQNWNGLEIVKALKKAEKKFKTFDRYQRIENFNLTLKPYQTQSQEKWSQFLNYALQRSLEKKPHHVTNPSEQAEGLCAQGEEFLKSNHLELAIDAFEASYKLAPTRRALIGLGTISRHSFAFDEAMTFYQKALSLKLDDIDALNGIGLTFLKINMPEDALVWFEKALGFDVKQKVTVTGFLQAISLCQNTRASAQALERFYKELAEDLQIKGQLDRLRMNLDLRQN